jgi:hypothetical protein
MRIVYSLNPPVTTEIDALHNLLDRCCPEDALMRADIVRFRQAVADGTCRIETAGDEAPPPETQFEGNPA